MAEIECVSYLWAELDEIAAWEMGSTWAGGWSVLILQTGTKVDSTIAECVTEQSLNLGEVTA